MKDSWTEFEIYATWESPDEDLEVQFIGQVTLPDTDDTSQWPTELEINGVIYKIQP